MSSFIFSTLYWTFVFFLEIEKYWLSTFPCSLKLWLFIGRSLLTAGECCEVGLLSARAATSITTTQHISSLWILIDLESESIPKDRLQSVMGEDWTNNLVSVVSNKLKFGVAILTHRDNRHCILYKSLSLRGGLIWMELGFTRFLKSFAKSMLPVQLKRSSVNLKTSFNPFVRSKKALVQCKTSVFWSYGLSSNTVPFDPADPLQGDEPLHLKGSTPKNKPLQVNWWNPPTS